jgi:hypothetical protein
VVDPVAYESVGSVALDSVAWGSVALIVPVAPVAAVALVAIVAGLDLLEVVKRTLVSAGTRYNLPRSSRSCRREEVCRLCWVRSWYSVYICVYVCMCIYVCICVCVCMWQKASLSLC